MKRAILYFLVFVMVSCGGSTVITSNEPEEFEKSLKPEAVIIDVRTPEEFQEGHLENAVNINFFDADFDTQIAKFKDEKKIYVYCKSGRRSSLAASKMEELGFKKVINLEGGIQAWKSVKKPVVTN